MAVFTDSREKDGWTSARRYGTTLAAALLTLCVLRTWTAFPVWQTVPVLTVLLSIAAGILMAQREARRRSQDELREAAERLALVVGAMKLGTLDWSLAATGDADSGTARFLSGIQAEDRERVEQAFVSARSGARGGRFAEEYRTLPLPGRQEGITYAWGHFVFARGKAVRFRGFTREGVAARDRIGDRWENDERIRLLFHTNVVGFMIADRETILEANDHYLRMIGYSRQELQSGALRWDVLDPPGYRRTSGGTCESEYIRKDGSRVPVLTGGVPFGDAADGRGERFLYLVLDLSGRKSLENQIRQSQKLESMGQLAGGVAHDFNNLLTVILGYSRTLLEETDPGTRAASHIREIRDAASCAESLTRQLLTFSQRQSSEAKVLAANEAVLAIDSMLRRLIGVDIEIRLLVGEAAGFIRMDPAHFEQVVMNLALNARDAMPGGGTIFIETSQTVVGSEFASLCLGAPPGTYFRLSVSDTGAGMTEEIQTHIFEPFFTTKETGKGTGLGLSMVFGIVKESGGYIRVHSAPGLGSTFQVLLPATEPPARAGEPGFSLEPELDGRETILLLEDEAGVRRYVSQLLRRHGYQVLDAANGADGIELVRRYQGPIHLLLSDLVMPGRSGIASSEEIRSLRPGIRVLRMSGYSELLGMELEPGTDYIQKPFAPDALLRQIRTLLDFQVAGAGASSDPRGESGNV